MQIWNFIISITGAILADRIGRRSLWMTSLVGMMCANIGITVTSAVFEKKENDSAAYMAIAFLFMYNAGFNIACNPLLYSYPTEILPYSMRTKGLAAVVAIAQALLIVSQYANPVAIAAIGWKYWIFFLGMLVLFLAMVYFTYPETKGLTLEELARLFEDDETTNMAEKIESIEGVTDVVTVVVVEKTVPVEKKE
jgi:MFS family permease